MKKLIPTISLILISTLTVSCGRGNSTIKNEFSPSALLAEEKNLTNEELIIATRICYAYRSKSQKFRTTEFFGKSINFRATQTDCQNTSFSYDIPTTLKYDDQNALAYVPSGGFDTNLRFNKKVQTEDSGYLSQLCPKVLTNQPVLNTSTVQNVKAQISFFRGPDNQNSSIMIDGYLIQYFMRQADGKYTIDSAEKFTVPTETVNTATRVTGIDYFYSTQKVCQSAQFDKRKNSDFIQSFTSR